jgi:vacuolar iron transporter family protein
MKSSIKKGFGFGLTSGIITTLGLIVGLNSSTGSKSVVIGRIIVIAIADALSDSLGVHISEESEKRHTIKEIWETTISTFFFKFITALLFIIPILNFSLSSAVKISVAIGLFGIGLLSYWIAKQRKTNPWHAVMEHLIIAIFVIVATHYIGEWIAILSVE